MNTNDTNHNLPNPTGPPEPYDPNLEYISPTGRREGIRWSAVYTGLAILAGSGWLFLHATSRHVTRGVGRSTRLLWEQRQQEIESTLRQAEEAPQDAEKNARPADSGQADPPA